MRGSRLVWVLTLGGTLAAALIPAPASAVPAFARRHKVSCTTCHAPFPKLKAYGDEFAGDGFWMPDDDKDRDYITAGDDLLRLNRDFPVAGRLDAYGVYEEDQAAESDLQAPWGLKLVSGGALYRSIGYYFYFYMSERGEVAGIEDAYIHFNDLLGAPFDIMVGQFQTSDPLMKRELRLTYEDYAIYKERIGDSHTNLAYDRGVMLTYGVAATRTDLVGMVVNGNGKPEAGSARKYDRDKEKNIGLRVNQAVGELGSLGFFFYAGEERYAGGARNEVTYWGPDFSLAAGPLELTGQYLHREDSEPVDHAWWGAVPPDDAGDTETDGFVGEAVFSPQGPDGRWFFVLLYNQISSDLNPSDFPVAMLENPDYETLTGGVSYLVARNLRLMGEFTRDLEYERSRALVGLVAGF